MQREIEITVKLVFDIDVPDNIRTPDRILAAHLVDKLAVDAKWATLKSREIVEDHFS